MFKKFNERKGKLYIITDTSGKNVGSATTLTKVKTQAKKLKNKELVIFKSFGSIKK